MADNDETLIQLELPLVWWHDTKLWRDRHHVSSINRPTEDEALDNVYYSSRAVNGKFGRELNGLERKVYHYELLSIHTNPRYFTDTDHQKYIAGKTGLTVHMVKDVLNGVHYLIRELVRMDDLAIEASYKQAAKEILCELSAEEHTLRKAS